MSTLTPPRLAVSTCSARDRLCVRSAVLRDWAVLGAWFIGLSAAYWIAVFLVDGRPGFPLDDAFIHLQFARNLFERGEMSFNPGIPSSGCTAPAFPVLLAAAHSLVRDWYAAAYLVSAVFSLGTAWVVYAIILTWTRRRALALWAGLLTLVASPTVTLAYSGMEAPVYCFLLLSGLWLYGRGTMGGRFAGTAFFALAVWFRPEFFLLCPLVLLERCVTAFRAGRGRLRRVFLESIGILAFWGVVAVAYAAYHWHQDGHWVPTTFGAKVAAPFALKPVWLEGLPALLRRGSWGHVLLNLGVWPILNLTLIGLGIGAICLPLSFGLGKALGALWKDGGPAASGWRLAILILIGYPLFRAPIDPAGTIWFQGQRYFAHLTPLVVLIVLGALPKTGAVLARPVWDWRGLPLSIQRRRTLAWAFGASLLPGAVAVLSVGNINDMQVNLAEWLRSHTRPDDLIATNDIGAIAFLTRRPILDTVGLVEPEIVEHYKAGGTPEAYLMRHHPAYVVLFPSWYEALCRREDLLERVHGIRLDLNVVCGGSEMVVYRPRWTARSPDAVTRAVPD